LDRCLHQDGVNFTLFSDQFHRFLISQKTLTSGLHIKVYEEGQMIHEEKIELPSRISNQYLIEQGMIHIPETNLEKHFGFELRMSYLPSLHKNGLIISQKCKSAKYTFVICTQAQEILYVSNYMRSPPWQLKILTQFDPTQVNAPHFHQEPSGIIFTEYQPQNGIELLPSPLLNQFVQELKGNALALTQFVYNEIELRSSLHQLDNTYYPVGVIRDPTTTFLEKRGSPWEQCMLLVYLLREAGFQAYYLLEGKSLLPKDYIERLFFTQLPDSEEISLYCPGVLFHSGEKWISLFPWLKEIEVKEGYDLYNILPEKYASADRWLKHYLNANSGLAHRKEW
jgi:hypothetical protein